MALRNLFDGLATEGTLQRLLRAVTFSKDPADRLRVAVDSSIGLTATVSGTVTTNNLVGNSATNLAQRNWYDATSTNMVDEREFLRHAMRANYQRNMARWSIS